MASSLPALPPTYGDCGANGTFLWNICRMPVAFSGSSPSALPRAFCTRTHTRALRTHTATAPPRATAPFTPRTPFLLALPAPPHTHTLYAAAARTTPHARAHHPHYQHYPFLPHLPHHHWSSGLDHRQIRMTWFPHALPPHPHPSPFPGPHSPTFPSDPTPPPLPHTLRAILHTAFDRISHTHTHTPFCRNSLAICWRNNDGA